MVLRLDGEGARQDFPLPARRARTHAAHREKPRHDRQARRARRAEVRASRAMRRPRPGTAKRRWSSTTRRRSSTLTRSTSCSRPATRSASCTAGSCAATTRFATTRRIGSSTWTSRGTARWYPATCTSRRVRARSRSSSTCRAATRPRKRGRIRTTTRRSSAACMRSRSTGRGRARATCAAYVSPRTTTKNAASSAIGYLSQRPEVDPQKIGVYALSFGSFWGMRIAATEHRIAAAACPWASFVDKYYLMTEESPRYKQLFAYLTQSSTEEELDKVWESMTMEGLMDKITVPDAARCRRIRPARADRRKSTGCSTR